MKRILSILVLIIIGSNLFSQELSSIVGTSSVKPGSIYTYYIYFDQEVTKSTNISIVSNYGSFDKVGGATTTTKTISSGNYFTVTVFWQDKTAKDGYIIAYKVNEVGKTVELKGIVISKDATSQDASSTKPQPLRIDKEVYSEETFRLGFTDNDPNFNYSIQDYTYDESLLTIVSKDDLGITFIPKQIIGSTRTLVSIKIKSKFSPASPYISNEYSSTWSFPIVGTAFITPNDKVACPGSKITYSITNFIGSYSDIKWTAGANTTLISAQNGNATFQVSGDGYANVKASIKSRGKDYNRENSEVWIGAPNPTITVDASKLSFLTTYNLYINNAGGATSYKWTLIGNATFENGSTTTTSTTNQIKIKTGANNDPGMGQILRVTCDVTNKCGTTTRSSNFMFVISGLRSASIENIDQPEIKSVKIYNLSGVLVYSNNAINGTFDITSTVLTDGVYIIEKFDGENRTSEKVMLRR